MDDIRLFIKKNAITKTRLIIKYNDDHTSFDYKVNGVNFILKEFLNEDNDSYIHLVLNNKTYDNFNDIQLILFELFDYKNIEYIDVYLKKIVENKQLLLTDFYNDYYDDYNDKLICTRRIYKENDEIAKLKFVVSEKTNINLYYKDETISGIDEIITKINEIFIIYN